MIACLRGNVVAIGADNAVIECAGVGYRFLAAPATLAGLRRGQEATVITHLVVKEDSLTLYGFSGEEQREMFLLLQTVSGLGPKLALACLGCFGPGEIARAVAASDAKTLQTIPGVGKRMADRLVVELKDKVAAFAPAESEAEVTAPLPAGAAQVAQQVTEALVGLGFTDRVAGPVVEGVVAENPDITTAAALRTSLAQLGRA
ncbi:Holliday junction branch migration protein RuvA [Corynebacterium uterequi]|uniref:Holliday junction branch migration complex subunit RuvA n=1 Tax=Corynebacterium uterequi TaxID=1072256 RepID=A0A0G3HH41_9CORY|nr:Holliday junction branch migration protein RuvA [Corynebacterium uterequi]AKK11238.1 Holliday junction DNA helicase subunit RuvA [Corynebacterium uterequi]